MFLRKSHCVLDPERAISKAGLEPGAGSQEGRPQRQGDEAALFWAQFQGQLQGEQAVAVCLQLAVIRPGLSLTWGIFKETLPAGHVNRKNAHISMLAVLSLQPSLLFLLCSSQAMDFTYRQRIAGSSASPRCRWYHLGTLSDAPGPLCPLTELAKSSGD